MQSIEKHIIDLFRKHDCVIVPDFGGFLLTYKSARFSPSGDELLPPSKVVSFNRSLVTNDGLLASSVASHENIAYSEAIGQVADKVRIWKDQLNSFREVRIDDVGVINLNNEGKWQFQPASTQNFLTSSFGLSTLQIRLEEAPEIRHSREEDEESIIKPIRAYRLPGIIAIAASILIIMGLSGVLFNSYFKSFSGIAGIGNIFHKQEALVSPQPKQEAKATNEIPNQVPVSTKADVQPAPTNEKQPVVEKEKPTAVKEESTVEVAKTSPVVAKHTTIEKVKITTDPESGFYVIVGCFTMKSNAVRFVKILKTKGYQPELIHNNESMFRVSYKMDSDSLTADSYLKEIREKGDEDAWLLHLN